MFLAQKITAVTTVDELAAEIYDLTSHGVSDPARLAEAVAALRDLNPTLPADDSDVDLDETPFVFLRRIPRTYWRLPATDPGLRKDLERLGIRNTAALTRLSPGFLARRLPDHDRAVLNRYRNLARLMRIRGVDRVTAAFFHDHKTSALRTPGDVARADPTLIRRLLIDSGFPRELLAKQPWRWISGHAKMVASPRRRRRSQLRPILISRRELSRDAAFWADRAATGDKAAAVSAARIEWMRRLQGEMVRGNAAVAERDAAVAYRHLRRVWSMAGERAVADGIIPAHSREADGPSVVTVIELTRRMLLELRSGDVRTAIDRLELEPVDEGAPTDRTVRHTPTVAPELGPFILDLDDTFTATYRREVLAALLDHTGGAGWDFAPIDFADPARFAFVLPQLFARHLPMTLARCLDQLGRPAMAQALRIGGVAHSKDHRHAPASAGRAAATAPLADLIAEGTLASSQEPINCSDLDAVFERLHADNERGDISYQAGLNNDAIACYVAVLETAEGCQNLAGIIAALPAAHEALIAQAHDWLAGRSAGFVGVFDMMVITDRDQNPLIDGVWREPAQIERSPIQAAADDRIDFFTSGGGIIFNIPETEGTGDGGFDLDDRDDDLDDDEIYIIELPGTVVIHPNPGPGGGGDPPPYDPVGPPATYMYDLDDLEREVLHAFSYLSQVLAGLNWLGFDPQMVPVWSFEHLLGQGRYFGEKADGLQQRALSLLGSAELREREEFTAAASAAMAAQGVAIAKVQEAVARANLQAAQTSRDAAEQAEKHTKDDVLWAIGLGLAAVAAVVLAAPTGGASIAVATAGGAALAAAASGERRDSVAAGAVDAGASTAAQIDSAVEGQQQASSQLEVAEANVAVAAEQVALGVEQTALAQMESAIAAGYLDLLVSQTLTASAYYELLDVISFLAGRYLLMANRLAWMAERAYQRESRRYASYVQMSYDRPDELAGRFTSAATLLSHLDALAHEQLTAATERNQLLCTTYSLLISNPTALVGLQLTGVTQFQLTQKELDQRFPGLYLHSLDRIEVEFDGLIPAGGVRAVLRTANQTSARVPHEAGLYFIDGSELESDWCYPAAEFPIASSTNPPRFAIKTLNGTGFTQVLSEYRRSRDGVVLRVPAGALDSFAHLGVDALWTLEIPRSGNAFPLTNIVDVRVVLYFSAIYSAELAVRQVEALRADRVGRNAILAATVHAADDFSRLVSAPIDDRLRDVRLLRLDITSADLPANIADRLFGNVSLFVYGTDGRPLAIRLATTRAPLGAAVTTSSGMVDVPDGMAYSAVGDNATEHPDAPAVYRHREGDFPVLDELANQLRAAAADVVGRWVIKVLPEDNPDWLRRDDDGDTVTVRSGAVVLSDRGSVDFGGEFRHAAVTARLVLGPGTVAVALRTDVGVTIEVSGSVASFTLRFGAAAASVTAQVARFDVLYELELTVHDRDAAVALDGVQLVTVHVDEAVAAAAAPGPLRIGFVGPKSTEVADVRVTRLRHDGAALHEVLRETFATADAVTLSAIGALWESREHQQLDLGGIDEVLVQLDYDGRIDFLDGAGRPS